MHENDKQENDTSHREPSSNERSGASNDRPSNRQQAQRKSAPVPEFTSKPTDLPDYDDRPGHSAGDVERHVPQLPSKQPGLPKTSAPNEGGQTRSPRTDAPSYGDAEPGDPRSTDVEASGRSAGTTPTGAGEQPGQTAE